MNARSVNSLLVSCSRIPRLTATSPHPFRGQNALITPKLQRKQRPLPESYPLHNTHETNDSGLPPPPPHNAEHPKQNKTPPNPARNQGRHRGGSARCGISTNSLRARRISKKKKERDDGQDLAPGTARRRPLGRAGGGGGAEAAEQRELEDARGQHGRGGSAARRKAVELRRGEVKGKGKGRGECLEREETR